MPDRFPKPWRVEELEESFVVKDANGFSITWFYYRDKPVVGTGGERMTKKQALIMARKFAALGQ